jgi:hypothetical protein
MNCTANPYTPGPILLESPAVRSMRAKFLLAIGTLSFPSTTSALCPVPEIKANGEFFKSDSVFTGTVITERYKVRQNESGWFYRVRADQILRGPVQKEFTVHTEDDSNRFSLQQGREYLLFATRTRGRMDVSSCGNSGPLSDAGKSLHVIERIQSLVDGEIEGWVVPEATGVDVSGIEVKVRSESQVYSAITDKGGYFHFRAPKGRYKVDFSSGEYHLNSDDEFWYDPKNFTLHEGESAALLLISVRHPKQ